MIDTLEIEGLGPIVITEVEIQQVGPAGPNVITDLISAGTNVTFAGSGTVASPYVVSASGGGDGTVTSVALTVPDGLTVTGTPITEAGTLTVTLTAGYVIPTQATLDGKQPFSSILANTTASFTAAQESQLTGLQAELDSKQLVSRRTFTPDSAGWWRVAQHVDVIGCRMSITAPEHAANPTRTTDIELNVHANATTRGVMSQLRHSVRGGGHISEVRTARGQDGFVVFDINVTATGSPITLEARGLLFSGFVATPVKIEDEIASNSTTFLEDLALGNGLRTTGGLVYHLGSSRDPGQPLAVNGRAGYVHVLRLAAGSDRFTRASDHFHILMGGGVSVFHRGGARTEESELPDSWNRFQIQNTNSENSNDLFAGGINMFTFGEALVNQAGRHGISTDRVQVTGPEFEGEPGPPAEPNFDAEVDFWFTSNTGLPANGATVMVDFPVGIAGISAAILPGVVVSNTLMDAPDGRANSRRLRVRLSGLDPIEWRPDGATDFDGDLSWSMSSVPNALGGNVSLTPHPTRRDKVIAVFNENHGMHLGQVVVLRLPNAVWKVEAGSYSGCITEVISDKSFEMRIGIARRKQHIELGTREYLSRFTGGTEGANILRVANHPFVDGDSVKLSVIGTMQTGLEEGVTYWIELHGSQPAHWFYLHPSSDISDSATRVAFTSLSGRGIYFIHLATALDALGDGGWSIHKGNRDPVHQQTISDVGWSMHRNVFPNRRGLAAGTIAQATLGGLCDIPKWATGSAAVGFDCAAEADFAYAFGRGVRNSTTNSVEIGASDAKKLRITDSGLEVVTAGVAAPLVPEQLTYVTHASGGLTLNATNCGPSTVIRSTGADAFNITVTPDQPTGRHWIVRQAGAGVGTVLEPTGGSRNGDKYKTAGQHTMMSIEHVGGNALDFEGGAA